MTQTCDRCGHAEPDAEPNYWGKYIVATLARNSAIVAILCPDCVELFLAWLRECGEHPELRAAGGVRT